MKRLASLPPLIQCGLAHAQFETLHPFHDGNGGIGRLLITLILCSRGVLRRSLLYLSLFLSAHRTEYYDRLIAIRNDGAWETWLKFFLRGVAEVSRSAVDTAGNIMKLREEHRQLIGERITRPSAMAMLDLLYEHLLTTTNAIAEHLKCSFTAANRLISEFMELELLREMTGRQRNRRFRYDPYLAIFDQLNRQSG